MAMMAATQMVLKSKMCNQLTPNKNNNLNQVMNLNWINTETLFILQIQENNGVSWNKLIIISESLILILSILNRLKRLVCQC